MEQGIQDPPPLDEAEIEVQRTEQYHACVERSRQNARELTQRGVTRHPKIVDAEMIEFYGSLKDGNNDQFGRWFTNCSAFRITINDGDGARIYSSTEHYFQMQKFTLRANDANLVAWCRERGVSIDRQLELNRGKIDALATLSPVQVAKSGRSQDFPIRADWERAKYGVMYRALIAKFSQHEECKAKLFETGNKILIEKSPTDACWAINNEGRGENMLGILLMIVRELLRD
jgi:ribA/ribD-fused uncharacterized protein